MASSTSEAIEYFRGDESSGVTPPNLLKDCSYSEHVVHARGKRDKYSSVSLSPESIRIFGDTLWQLKCKECRSEGHILVEHQQLVASLQHTIKTEDKGERARAIQALRYAKLRKEGLVDWHFDFSGVERKVLDTWTTIKVRAFFSRR